MNVEEYWKYAFPAKWLVEWLTQHKTPLNRYEFMIDGLSHDGEPFVRRFVCVETAKQLRDKLVECRAQALHVGAVYSGPVSDVKRLRHCPSMKPHPVHQFLTLDIDLTDYPWALPCMDVNTADKAWCVAATALVFLKGVLQENFGYDEFLAVYSGRRGLHLHVCDKRAFELSHEGRCAIVEYLNFEFSKDNGNTANRDTVRVVRMAELVSDVERAFSEVIVSHFDLLGTHEGVSALVDALGPDCIPEKGLSMDLMELSTGPQRWSKLRQIVEDRIGASQMIPHRRQKLCDDLLAAQISFVWPRIDAAVASLGHTSKVPYSPHAKTRCIACPIDADTPYLFDPRRGPSLNDEGLSERLRDTIPPARSGSKAKTRSDDSMEW